MDDPKEQVLAGLQELIIRGASATARRYYVPTHDPDSDGDVIKAGQEQVKELRRIRNEFENLILGFPEK